MAGQIDRLSERPVPGSAVDEWLFAAWTPDGSTGVISGHRILGRHAWYWSAHVRAGRPLLHLAEWEVKVRPDPMVVKAPEMWAEHLCEEPLQQWSIGNEAYFAELDRPDDALGRGYGIPTPTAFDLEWYATDPPEALADGPDDPTANVIGFRQTGVVHGVVEVLGRPITELVEVPALRWRRTSNSNGIGPIALDSVVAHSGLRAPFRFPDGTVADWVLSPDGWRDRRHSAGQV